MLQDRTGAERRGKAERAAIRHVPHACFRYPAYRLFYSARLSNNLGTNIMMPALGWQIYDLTHDPASLGLIGLAVFLPVLAVTLPSGQVADRFERGRVYRLAQFVLMAAAGSLVALTLSESRTSGWFYLCAALWGAAKTFSAPAATAWMPQLVPREHFPNAIAWTSSAFQLSSVIGPSIAGVALHAVGQAATYGMAVVLYFMSFLFAFLIRIRSRGDDTGPVGLTHLLGGIHYIRRDPLILGATTMDLFAVLLGGATALLPVYARDILHMGTAGFGLLRSAPAIGAVSTALLFAFRPLRRRVGRWMFAAVTCYGVATIVFGLSRSFAVSMAALIVLGSADMVSNLVRSTLVQLAMRDNMRGRVSSVNMVFNSAANELGDMESGFMASLLGTVPAVVIGGLGTLVVASLWSRWFPQLRNADRLVGNEPVSATLAPVTAAD